MLPEPISRGDDAFLPVHEKVLHAFELVRPENVKCVVVGMCPYKKRDQACGLGALERAARLRLLSLEY